MTLTVFTSNQPRHLALLRRLCSFGDVTAIIEPKSFCPWGESTILREYWSRVQAAERDIFPAGRVEGVSLTLRCIPMGEASKLSRDWYGEALEADRLIVFGSSFLTGWLAEHLIQRNALNLHGGLAPYYRGAAPNFWAVYDRRPDLVGAQVQRLSKGLDAGAILATTEPWDFADGDPFVQGMLAIRRGIDLLEETLISSAPPWGPPVTENDRTKEVAYHRAVDFTEAVAAEVLAR